MPFPLIPTTLAIGFLLVWVLIVGMLFRDGQLASRRERESEPNLLPLPMRRTPATRAGNVPRMKRVYKKSAVRAAS
jgi:hypothetical protein